MMRQKPQKTEARKISELEELSRLTGGLAHEMKNPLSIVKVNLKLISEDLAASKDQNTVRAAKKIAVVQKETDRLEQILEDFLRYIRKTELHPASVDINKLVSDMIDFYSPQATSRSITIRQAMCGEPLICFVDSNSLKQVLLNLFINAQQAMPGGELIVTTQKMNNDAVITVTDTGKGIEPENLEKIFDAYYSTKVGGSGLGLPTSKKIIEAHKGSIKVDSIIGKGTSFTILLPLESKY
ncbi:MAG: two-component sensor histidine kinase [Planctomycetaceae bacterium]|nr:two-component sensor histidine kinase [Planctomycetaceae bacterium]